MYQPKILSPYACRDSSGSYRRKTPLNTPNTVKPGGEHRECPYFKKKVSVSVLSGFNLEKM